MRLTHLEVRDFRNIAKAEIIPGPGLNLIVGQNGQGKTNLVEAIVFLSWLRSFRTNKTADLVAQDKNKALLRAEFEDREGKHYVEALVERGCRKVVLDGHVVRSAGECMRRFRVVSLSADDPAILEGGPEGRRLLVDRTVVLLDTDMAEVYTRFQKLLKERNALLRRMVEGAVDEYLLAACEEALAVEGMRVASARVEVLSKITPLMVDIVQKITGYDLRLEVRYQSRWFSTNKSPAVLLESMQRHRQQDAAIGYTTTGPQSDDILINVLDLPARGHVSRGQRKALMLAWKGAEGILVKAKVGEAPLMVLDDAFSDLDKERQGMLAGWLASLDCQSFLTATETPNLQVLSRVKTFRASKGEFAEV